MVCAPGCNHVSAKEQLSEGVLLSAGQGETEEDGKEGDKDDDVDDVVVRPHSCDQVGAKDWDGCCWRGVTVMRKRVQG